MFATSDQWLSPKNNLPCCVTVWLEQSKEMTRGPQHHKLSRDNHSNCRSQVTIWSEHRIHAAFRRATTTARQLHTIPLWLRHGTTAREVLAGSDDAGSQSRAGDSNVNGQGPWKPTWESLDKHQVPDWFLDGKLGIMINWGLHSVPGLGIDTCGGNGPLYPDACGCYFYSRKQLDKFWGPDVAFDDFFPLFRASIMIRMPGWSYSARPAHDT